VAHSSTPHGNTNPCPHPRESARRTRLKRTDKLKDLDERKARVLEQQATTSQGIADLEKRYWDALVENRQLRCDIAALRAAHPRLDSLCPPSATSAQPSQPLPPGGFLSALTAVPLPVLPSVGVPPAGMPSLPDFGMPLLALPPPLCTGMPAGLPDPAQLLQLPQLPPALTFSSMLEGGDGAQPPLSLFASGVPQLPAAGIGAYGVPFAPPDLPPAPSDAPELPH